MPLLSTTETMPLLEEVLEQTADKVPLLIELKNHSLRVGKLERNVLTLLQGYSGEVAIQSFNALSVLWYKRHVPAIWRGQLSSGGFGIPLQRFTTPHFAAYNVHSLPNRAMQNLRAEGVPLFAWTIRTCAEQT